MSRRRPPLLLSLVVCVVVVLGALWAGRVVQHSLAAARLVQERLAWAQQMGGAAGEGPSASEMDSLASDLAALSLHLQSLHSDLRSVLFVLDRSGWAPVIGPELQAAPHLLDLGIELTAAACAAFPLVRQVADLADGGARLTPGALLVAIVDAAPALAAARQHVAAAQRARAAITGTSFRTRLGGYLSRLDHYLPLLDRGLAALQALPVALGADGPRTYLLLAQNSDELRATGGLISSVGTVTVQQGQVTRLDMRDSYTVDDITVPHPVPPDPFIRYMHIGVLLLRDTNWWPDFPTSAALAMDVWELDQRQRVDGVVALDLEGVRLLVEALGPFTIEGEAQPLDGGNVLNVLRQSWGVVPDAEDEKGLWWLGRKDIVGALARAALAKLQTAAGGPDMLLRLARSLQRAVDGKHLLVYASDPALRFLLAEAGADGAVAPTRGDYLMVVDSNMGFNKVNARITQSIDYRVDLANDGRSRAHLTVTYTNTAAVRLAECVYGPSYGRVYEDMMERCYWDYARLYAPWGSTLLLDARSPDLEVGSDDDKSTVATFFDLAPGSSHELQVNYLLPDGIVQGKGSAWRYTLLIQKQGGSAERPLTVAVTLPAGALLAEARPQPTNKAGDTLFFAATLDRDLSFEVTYAR